MKPFSDTLIDAIQRKGNPCAVGLDPRVSEMPSFLTKKVFSGRNPTAESVSRCIIEFHRRVLDLVADLVPVVKPQLAFFEQYGPPGLLAFAETVGMAKDRGLLVIADAKRCDIASTAHAYSNSFLGGANLWGTEIPGYGVDSITVSPYLGSDSIEPFVEACDRYGKGIFVLVKTSNRGSKDFQDLRVTEESVPMYVKVAEMVERQSLKLIGESGYSSIGAVVGATFPAEAELLRQLMPRSIFLVPGYGSQGGTAFDAAHCFDEDGLGAIVSASRSITYSLNSNEVSAAEFDDLVRSRVCKMVADIKAAVVARTSRRPG